MHGQERNWQGQIHFAYLDIDDPQTEPFKRALGYRVQPHLFLLDADGNIIQQWLGSVSSDQLSAAFEEAVQ